MIKVWSNVHCSFAALHLVNQLKKLGYESMIINEWDKDDESLHILYQVSNKVNLPKNYIVYQTEPYYSHWFNANYRETIKNAKAVWEYEAANLSHYNHENKTVVYPGVFPQPPKIKDIDLLFYGHIDGSPRRREMIEQMQSFFHVEVVKNTVGQQMWDILARTKTVVNLHYEDQQENVNEVLEMFRISESLSFGCKVVSEFRYGHEGILPLNGKFMWLNQSNLLKDVFDNTEQIKHGLELAGL